MSEESRDSNSMASIDLESQRGVMNHLAYSELMESPKNINRTIVHSRKSNKSLKLFISAQSRVQLKAFPWDIQGLLAF